MLINSLKKYNLSLEKSVRSARFSMEKRA